MKKREMGIDVETYSGTSIKDGVYAYVDDPDFEIMLITYVDPYRKNEDNTPIYYTFVPEKFAQRHPGKVDPNDCNPEAERRFRYLLMDGKIKKTAFNANFERTTLAAYYNEISCPPEQWQCTMVLAATLGYPHSLEKVGEVMELGEDKKKEKIGKELIRYFSAPVKPTKKNDHRTRNLPMDDPEKWNQFKEYNHQDVVAEQAIYQALKIYTPNNKEKAFWDMDQRINDRGIRIDVPFVEQIVAFDKAEQERKLKEMKELTGLENPNSAAQLKKWLAENGAPEFKNSLRKEDIKEALEKGTYKDKPKIEKALRGRLETSKSSIKKYYTMLNTMDEEGRCKGMFQFYGASRTGRWAGRRLQLQNLAKNKIEDLDEVRSAVARGDWESVRKKYPDTADIESQLVRTALVPSKGNRFIVTDFSAIEARVIAWIAGEEWRLKAFKNGEDIYCVSASKIFGVPVEKHGINGELRAQGKVAELACIAEGQLVLTNHGLIPIQDITTNDLVWDGEGWVQHDGVVCRGIKEVITYEGLTATPDHYVWVEGQERPVQFGLASASGAHLLQTGDSGTPIRMGKNNLPRKTMEQSMGSLLCFDSMYSLQEYSMANSGEFNIRKIEGLSAMFSATPNPPLAGSTIDGSQAEMYKSSRSGISQLRRSGNQILFPINYRSGTLFNQYFWYAIQRSRVRQNQHKWQLRTRKSPFCNSCAKLCESTQNYLDKIRAAILAICLFNRNSETIFRRDPGGNHSRRAKSSNRETEKLEKHSKKVKVYDIRNAGRHHRYTVSGKLVHNCGYNGGLNAMKRMDFAHVINDDEKYKRIVQEWREASPNITRFWRVIEDKAYDVIRTEMACMEVGEEQNKPEVIPIPNTNKKLLLYYKDNNLWIQLPSGRSICYPNAVEKENVFGHKQITFQGTDTQGNWVTIETYGGKLTENVVQAIARDCLAEKMLKAENEGFQIVAHIHDEMVLDVPNDKHFQENFEKIDALMAEPIDWAPGLPLKGGTYACDYYRKD